MDKKLRLNEFNLIKVVLLYFKLRDYFHFLNSLKMVCLA